MVRGEGLAPELEDAQCLLLRFTRLSAICASSELWGLGVGGGWCLAGPGQSLVKHGEAVWVLLLGMVKSAQMTTSGQNAVVRTDCTTGQRDGPACVGS